MVAPTAEPQVDASIVQSMRPSDSWGMPVLTLALILLGRDEPTYHVVLTDRSSGKQLAHLACASETEATRLLQRVRSQIQDKQPPEGTSKRSFWKRILREARQPPPNTAP